MRTFDNNVLVAFFNMMNKKQILNKNKLINYKISLTSMLSNGPTGTPASHQPLKNSPDVELRRSRSSTPKHAKNVYKQH